MEQRNVVTTAIVAALLVAGFAWYVLSQRGQEQTAQLAEATPSPSPLMSLPIAAAPTPEPAAAVEAPPVAAPPETVNGAQQVATTAPSGPRENVIALLAAVTLVSGWHTLHQWRRQRAS